MSHMTTRERRERRADRYEEWAEKRAAKQADLNEAARADEAATGIPFGQPILVGHHSEGRHRAAIARIDRAMGAAVDNSRKAASMADRADTIRAQNDAAIYSDDSDAIEALTAKIEGLEAKRERIKRYNATCRKRAKTGLDNLTDEDKTQWQADLGTLEARERADLLGSIKAWGDIQCKGGRFPGYTLTNLGGQISTARKRLASLQREAEHGPTDRVITSRYGGACEDCGAALTRGELIRYNRQQGARCHPGCEEAA
jgi:hypothetical protein